MAKIGIAIVIIAIVASMGIAIYMYTQYQPKFEYVNAGDQVGVGPVQYIVTFEGTFEGDEQTKPEYTFVKIQIAAKNISNENTRISGGQFYLIDEDQQKHQPVYGEFSQNDLLDYWLEPNKPMIFTTQFDIIYDESKQYNVVIRPSKQQSTVDTAVICMTNC